MGHLRSTKNGELLKPAIPFRNHAATFDRRHALPRGSEGSRDLDRSLGRDLVEFRVVDDRFQEDILVPLFVDQRGTGIARLHHIVNSCQFLYTDTNLLHNVFGLGAVRREAHGDEFTDIADLVRRQGRLFGNIEAR